MLRVEVARGGPDPAHDSAEQVSEAEPHCLQAAAEGSDGDVVAILRELLGPEFYDKFFQFLDPEGHQRPQLPMPRNRSLPLSPLAKTNADRGLRTRPSSLPAK